MPDIIIDTPKNMAKKVARAIQREILKNNALERPTVLGLATGSTPIPVYQELVRLGIDFSRVITFNLDEYLGLGAGNPQSYRDFMEEHLFQHININRDNIHMLDGTVPEHLIEAHVKEYEAMIERVGGIDIQILGVGANGHIAFNEPKSSIDSRTRLVKLAEQTTQSNQRFFDPPEKVPTHALTMGIGTILQYSKQCYLLATGKGKAAIIDRILSTAEYDENLPATALHKHTRVSFVLDNDAASTLLTSFKPPSLLPHSMYAPSAKQTKSQGTTDESKQKLVA